MFAPKDVSSAFGIPLSTLYRHIRKGKLKVLRNPFGKGLFIYEDELPKLEALARVYREKNRRRGV